MGLFNFLPKAGNAFSFEDASRGFEEKLRNVCRRGELKNLEDNIDDILAVLKEYAPFNRKGGLSYGQRERVWQKIRRLGGSDITIEDKRDIKKLLQHFGS
jgi:hypothetical protein